MKKGILIIDWVLLILLAVMILAKILNWSFASVLQPIFLALIVLHVWQHRRIIATSLKGILKKQNKK